MLADVLDGVPWLLEQLAVTEARLDRVNTGLRAGKRPDRPMPFDQTAADLLDALANGVTGWVRHLCESRGIDYVPVGYLPGQFVGPLRLGERRVPADFVDTAPGTARWLRLHVESVRLDPAAGALFRELTSLAESALVAINPPPVLGFRGPCPTLVRMSEHAKPVECAHRLYADPEQPFVICERCGVRHDVAKLEQQLLARIGTELFELPKLLGVLRELGQPIPRGTVASWISREQLRPRAYRSGDQIVKDRQNTTDKPLYQLDDARRLRTATDLRPQR
ncbi:hypothetical protein [Nocardia sp. NPDC046763]|uniref:hypothetical protein n=1 Tax=Nocardia sp. NPDC046763 TaxID=3155256 RepID=UPI0033DA9002